MRKIDLLSNIEQSPISNREASKILSDLYSKAILEYGVDSWAIASLLAMEIKRHNIASVFCMLVGDKFKRVTIVTPECYDLEERCCEAIERLWSYKDLELNAKEIILGTSFDDDWLTAYVTSHDDWEDHKLNILSAMTTVADSVKLTVKGVTRVKPIAPTNYGVPPRTLIERYIDNVLSKYTNCPSNITKLSMLENNAVAYYDSIQNALDLGLLLMLPPGYVWTRPRARMLQASSRSEDPRLDIIEIINVPGRWRNR